MLQLRGGGGGGDRGGVNVNNSGHIRLGRVVRLKKAIGKRQSVVAPRWNRPKHRSRHCSYITNITFKVTGRPR